jgi:hypothetical protein
LPHIGRRSRSERRAFIVAVNDFYFDSRRSLTSGGEAGANDAHSSLLLMISILISRRSLTSGGEAGANDAHSSLLLMISILIPRRYLTSGGEAGA